MRRSFAGFFPNAAQPMAEPSGLVATTHSLGSRLDFVDGLRGIAALAVFFSHALPLVSPAFRAYVEPYFYFGNWGVALFLMCSGFILPVSLERQGSLGRFWVRRAFRLYPLYWVNVLLLAAFGVGEPRQILSGPPADSAKIVLANLTMFQGFMGIPHLITLYWTLTLELLFYLLLSLLFLLKLNARFSAATLVLIVLAIGAELIIPRPFAFSYSTHLLLVLVGMVAYRHYSGTLRPAVGVGVALLTPLMLLIPQILDPGNSQQQLAWVTAQLAAFVCFGVAYLLRARPVHPILRYFGRISYSTYLMHPFVLDRIAQLSNPILTLLVWLLALLLLASATYWWIERPMIAWGQRLTRSAVPAQASSNNK
ncbi:MAG TPA: acyltransferase [Roseiflexaceae bacterium]|nr:acyltransferase [Roseiflexaceae bacterium]